MKERSFVCPRCGGNKFGTAFTPDEQRLMVFRGDAAIKKLGTGHCHGVRATEDGIQTCGFQWLRSKDSEVMTGEEREIPDSAVAYPVRPAKSGRR